MNAAFVLFLCYVHITKGEKPTEIIVEKQVKKYGENLDLFCKIHGCCPKAAEWRVDGVPLFIDITQLDQSKTLGNPPKYKASRKANGIMFVILNVSLSDLNRTHECIYDDGQASMTLLIYDVFSNKSSGGNVLRPDLIINSLYFWVLPLIYT